MIHRIARPDAFALVLGLHERSMEYLFDLSISGVLRYSWKFVTYAILAS